MGRRPKIKVRGRKRTMGSRWTQAELTTLRTLWGEVSSRTIQRALRAHTWTAIRMKAREIGLPSRPQGHVALSVLADRCGVDFLTMRRVLEWASVATVQGYPAAGRNAFSSRAVKWLFVDEHDGLEAFERWLRAERAAEAAARLGQPAIRLWHRARSAGLLTPRRVARLAPEVWDQLAAKPLYSKKAVTTC
jgi:hypothetical protein